MKITRESSLFTSFLRSHLLACKHATNKKLYPNIEHRKEWAENARHWFKAMKESQLGEV